MDTTNHIPSNVYYASILFSVPCVSILINDVSHGRCGIDFKYVNRKHALCIDILSVLVNITL